MAIRGKLSSPGYSEPANAGTAGVGEVHARACLYGAELCFSEPADHMLSCGAAQKNSAHYAFVDFGRWAFEFF